VFVNILRREEKDEAEKKKGLGQLIVVDRAEATRLRSCEAYDVV
jgi:hypothetical protein